MVASNDLNISVAGFVTFDGVSTFNGRTITAGAGVSITNGNGVAGNPVISLVGGATAIDSIGVQTGTSPIVPTAAGLVTINGAVVAAGTNPVRSNGTGPNTLALEVQTSQAIAAGDATKIGLSNYDSASFGVSAAGFVTLNQKARVLAYLDVTLANATGDGTGVIPLIFDTAVVNIGSAYNVATGIFTAPRAGNYMVACTVMFTNLDTNHDEGELIFNIPIGAGDYYRFIGNPGLNRTNRTGYTNVNSFTMSGIIPLLAAQDFRIGVVVNGGTKTVGILGDSFALETNLSIFEL